MSQGQILVIGRNGQLANALLRIGRVGERTIYTMGRAELDLTQTEKMRNAITQQRPGLVINAAAYTAVDRAEEELDQAHELNGVAPGELAEILSDLDVPLIHVSTDYVFDGTASTPMSETDPVSPLGVYGMSKAEGETRIRAALDKHLIVRTAWVYSPDGTNFVKTMLRIGAGQDEINVVDDQYGSPTSADDLAEAICTMAAKVITGGDQVPWGTYHVTGSDIATWHEFATEIFRIAEVKEQGKWPKVHPIPTSSYPTPALRPQYSVLDNSRAREVFGIVMPDWRDSLARCMYVLMERH